MSISLKCRGCQSTLKVRDELAGKKVKCPRCQTVLVVPDEEEEVAAVVEEPPPRPRTGKTGRIQASQPAPRRKEAIRTTRRDEEDEYEDEDEAPRDDRRGRKGGKAGKGGKDSKKYKPCPECGAEGATRVKWTPWGSFYGPAMFTHVACPECGYCYNGKTGRSNLIPAIVFVTVPLVGILGIIGAIVYMLIQRNYLKF